MYIPIVMSVLYPSYMTQLRNCPCEIFTHLFSETNPFWMPVALCSFLIGLIFYCYFGLCSNFSFKNFYSFEKNVHLQENYKNSEVVILSHLLVSCTYVHTLLKFILTHLFESKLQARSLALNISVQFSSEKGIYFIWLSL